MEGDGSLNDAFRAVPASAVTNHAPIRVIPSATSISDAVSLLGKWGVLSAPIKDNSKPETVSWNDKYVGVGDFLAFIDWMISEAGHAPGSLAELKALAHTLHDTPVTSAVAKAKWSQFIPVDRDENTLLDVMLITGKWGVHRVWSVVAGGDLYGVISQANVVDYIATHIGMLGDLAHKTLAALGMHHADHIYTIPPTASPWDAFKIISEKVSGW